MQRIVTPDVLISVVIPICGRQVDLERQLAALARQPGNRDVEIIVVADYVEAGYSRRLAHPPSALDLRVIRNYTRVGRAIARNRGWRAARGLYIVFLDPEMIPADGWLDGYRRAILKRPDLVLGLTCSRPEENLRGTPRKGLPDLYKGEWIIGPPSGDDLAGAAVPLSPCGTPFAASNVLFSREVIRASRGFPPFLNDAAEDLDFGIRVAELRPSVLVACDAVAYCCLEGQRQAWTEVERRALVWRNPLTAVSSAAGFDRPSATAEPDAIPGVFVHELDDVAEHLAELAGEEKEVVREYIMGSVAQGLLTRSVEGRACFDLFHTLNRLRARTRYLEAEFRNASFPRTQGTPRQRGQIGARRITVHCRGVYTLQLDASWNLYSGAPTLNIGMPVERAGQRNCRLTGLMPSSLAPYVNVARGLIEKVPINMCISNQGLVGYEFECDLGEDVDPRDQKGCSPEGPERLCSLPTQYLRFTYPQEYKYLARALLSHILGGCSADHETDVRRIYRWIVENLTYSQTRLPDYAILETGTGNCIDLTRLFINLVRLRGVPAREQCGAMMTRALSEGEVQTVTLGFSPFTHTWADVFFDGVGWRPVDFVVICFGIWRANQFNVGPELRAELSAQSEQLLNYYCGNLDPYRIYGTSLNNKIPSVEPSRTAGAERLPPEAVARVRHKLRCWLSSVGSPMP